MTRVHKEPPPWHEARSLKISKLSALRKKATWTFLSRRVLITSEPCSQFLVALDSPLTDRCNDVRSRKIFNSFERDGFIIFPRERTSDEDLSLSVLDYLESSNSCDVRSAL